MSTENEQRTHFAGHGAPNSIEWREKPAFKCERHEIMDFLKKDLDFGTHARTESESLGVHYVVHGCILVPESNLSFFLGRARDGYLVGTYDDKSVILGTSYSSDSKDNVLAVSMGSTFTDGCRIVITLPIPAIVLPNGEKIMELQYLCSGEKVEDVITVVHKNSDVVAAATARPL